MPELARGAALGLAALYLVPRLLVGGLCRPGAGLSSADLELDADLVQAAVELLGLAAASAAGLWLGAARGRGEALPRSALARAALALVVLGASPVLWAYDGFGAARLALSRAVLLAVALSILGLAADPGARRVLLALLVATAAALGLGAIHSYAFDLAEARRALERDPALGRVAGEGLELDLRNRLYTDEAAAPFATSGLLAVAAVMGLALAAGCAWDSARSEGPGGHRYRLAALAASSAAALSSGAALVAARSAAGWGALGVAVLALALRLAGPRWRRATAALALAGALGLAAAAGSLGVRRVAAAVGGETLTVRVEYWAGALRMALDRPWTGWGLGAFGHLYPSYRPLMAEETQHAHGAVFQEWAETGLIGLAALAVFWGVALAGAWRPAGSPGAVPEGPVRLETLLAALGGLGGLAFLRGLPVPLAADPARLAMMALAWLAVYGALVRHLRPGRGVALGLYAGLAGLLAHGLLDVDLEDRAVHQWGLVLAAVALAPAAARAARGAAGPVLRWALGLVPLAAFLALGLVVLPAALRAWRHRVEARALEASGLEDGSTVPGFVAAGQGAVDRAIAEWGEAVRRSPWDRRARLTLARAHARRGELTGDPAEGARAEAGYREAAALVRPNLEEAARAHEAALEAFPGDPSQRWLAGMAWLALARAARDGAARDRGVAHLEAALEALPRESGFHRALAGAWLDEASGAPDPLRALHHLRAARATSPAQPRVRYDLARLCRDLAPTGDGPALRAEARREFAAALETSARVRNERLRLPAQELEACRAALRELEPGG
ncbi:MAG: O-antigen ligase family protein [Planctomycetes bacterium]|nr:O-antigen ligase family protein [Planctomycetota bacterium]